MDKTNFWKPGQSNPYAASSNHSLKKKSNDKKGKSNRDMIVAPKAAQAQAKSQAHGVGGKDGGGGTTCTPLLSKSVMSMKFMKRKNEENESQLIADANKRSRLLQDSSSSHVWEVALATATTTSDPDTNTSNVMDTIADPEEHEHDSASSTSAFAASSDTVNQMHVLNAQQSSNRASAIQALSSSSSSSSSSKSRLGLVCTYEATSLWAALPGRRSYGGFNKPVERHWSNVMEGRRQDISYGSGSTSGGAAGGVEGGAAMDKNKEEMEMMERYAKMTSLPRGPGKGGRKGGGGGGGGGKQQQAQGGKKRGIGGAKGGGGVDHGKR